MPLKNENFRALAEAIPQIVWISDPHGKLIFLNARWYEYIGTKRARGSIDEAEVVSHVHPRQLPEIQKRYDESRKNGTRIEFDYLLRGADGTYRWHLGRNVPVRDAKGKIVAWFGTATDIHEHRHAIDQLEQERGLRDDFVRALSHDLRTPLAVAKLNAEMLLKPAINPKQNIRMTQLILSSVSRADTMIQDLLDSSLIRAGQPVPLKLTQCDLCKIIRATMDDLKTVYGGRLKTNVRKPISGCWSQDGLRRVIENLVINAVKYGAHRKPITVSVHNNRNHVKIRVHNEGNPIQPDEQAKLFSSYQRSTKARKSGKKGWGIGLMLVRGIVESHGGSVNVTSSRKQGTTFEVVLPK